MRTACCSGFGGASSVSRAPRTSGGAVSICRARASRDAPRRGTPGGYHISPTSSRAKPTPTSASARDGGRAASPGRWRSPRFTPTPIRSRRAARTPRCARLRRATSWRCGNGSCRTRPGGLRALEMFGPNLAALAKGRQVIAVDLQGHGRTADIDRPLSVALMADDIAALIKHLGLASADVMGYSLGGGVALQTAIRHPEVVRKLVLVSTPFRRDGFYPEILAQQGQVGPAAAEAMKQTPMYQLYASLAQLI